MMCASGMRAVILAAYAVQRGASQAVFCGGTESMSNAPYVLERARAGLKFGDATLVDTLLRDGLVDSFRHEHMGLTAERLAREYEISREQQDAFALASQTRCAAAVAARRHGWPILACRWRHGGGRVTLAPRSRSLKVSHAADNETLVLCVPVLERCQRLAG